MPTGKVTVTMSNDYEYPGVRLNILIPRDTVMELSYTYGTDDKRLMQAIFYYALQELGEPYAQQSNSGRSPVKLVRRTRSTGESRHKRRQIRRAKG